MFTKSVYDKNTSCRKCKKIKINRKVKKALRELFLKNDKLLKNYIISDFQKIKYWSHLNNLDEIKDLLIKLRDEGIIYYGSIIINNTPEGIVDPPVIISSVKFTDYGVFYINNNRFKTFLKNYYLEISCGLVLAGIILLLF